MTLNTQVLQWDKTTGLLPAIIQDAKTNQVLMLGYMNEAALQTTLQTKEVTFYSRSKKRLWRKGETSGNTLTVVEVLADCDHDTLLISANRAGPTCHTGSTSCFGESSQTDWGIIQSLEDIIQDRKNLPSKTSYVSHLLTKGMSKIAQKVGEEGVEVVIAALENDQAHLCDEVADLLFHVLILLQAKQLTISHVLEVLKARRS